MDKNVYGSVTDDGELLLRERNRAFVNEITGVSAGGVRRFFNVSTKRTQERIEDAAEFAQSILDQIVAATIKHQIKTLQDKMMLAEAASYEALIDARRVLEEATQILTRVQEDAHTLPDGRRVYLSRDGSYAIEESGRKLSDDERNSVEWEAGRPTAEDFAEADRRQQDAQAEVDEIEAYRKQLEENRERLESGEDLEADELDDLEADLGAMPERVQRHYVAQGGALPVHSANAVTPPGSQGTKARFEPATPESF